MKEPDDGPNRDRNM